MIPSLGDARRLALSRRRDLLAEARGRLVQMRDAAAPEDAAARDALPALDEALARACAPSLDAAAAAPVRARLQLSAVDDAALARAVDDERMRLTARRDALAQDPRWADRYARARDVDARIAAIDASGDALERSVRELEQDARFMRLRRTGFGTADDTHPWYTFSFYQRRRVAEQVVAAHGAARGAKDFATLRHRHLDEKTALETLEGELKELHAEAEALARFNAEADEVENALLDVEAAVLAKLRESAMERLRPLADPALIEATAGLGAVEDAARALAFGRAEVRYLEAARAHLLERPAAEIAGALHELDDKLTRLDRDPASVGALPSAEEVEASTEQTVGALEERMRTYREIASALRSFSDVAAYVPGSGATLWDVMVPGYDGGFVDEVAMHRAMQAGQKPRGVDKTESWQGAADRARDALARRLAGDDD